MPQYIVALTDAKIAKLKPDASKRRVVYDPACSGLAVRIQPSNHKTFVLGARFPRDGGAFRRRELGQVGRMTLDAAREKARAWAKLIASGVDPRDDEERLARVAQIAAGNTFTAVAEAYMARRLRGQRRAARVEREIRKELIAIWGLRPITDITRRDVTNLIDAIIDRPSVKRKSSGAYARHIFGHVKLIFDWAINRDYGLGESSPVDRLKPMDLIGKKVVRLRVLDDDELRAIWNASGSLGYRDFASCELSPFFGSRSASKYSIRPMSVFFAFLAGRTPATADREAQLRSAPDAAGRSAGETKQ